MSKNSFTENFNNCVSGFPVVSVATHMVIHEGLIGDTLKLGALGLGAYGLYNGINGDPDAFGNALKSAGKTAGDFISGLGDENGALSKVGGAISSGMETAGTALNNGLQKGREWVQDLPIGKAFHLGGDVAAHRQNITADSTQYLNVTKKAMEDEISTMQQREDLTPTQKMEQKAGIENKYKQNANTYAEDQWAQKHGGQVWKTPQQKAAGDIISKNAQTVSTQTPIPSQASTPQPQTTSAQPGGMTSGAVRGALHSAGQIVRGMQSQKPAGAMRQTQTTPKSTQKPQTQINMPSSPTPAGQQSTSNFA